MSEHSRIVGAKHQFTHGGRTYEASLIDQEAQGRFEQRLFGRAKGAAKGMKELMTPEEYREHLADLNDLYVDGAFGFKTERGMRFLGTVEGGAYVLSQILGVSEHEALLIAADEPDEAAALMDVVLRDSFPLDYEKIARREAKKKAEAAAAKEAEEAKKGGVLTRDERRKLAAAARADQRYAVAQLLDYYHLTLAEYRGLTDWQLEALYRHPREKDGQLVRRALPLGDDPEMLARFKQPTSLEEELAGLDKADAALPGGLKNLEQARATVRDRWKTGVRVAGGPTDG